MRDYQCLICTHLHFNSEQYLIGHTWRGHSITVVYEQAHVLISEVKKNYKGIAMLLGNALIFSFEF